MKKLFAISACALAFAFNGVAQEAAKDCSCKECTCESCECKGCTEGNCQCSKKADKEEKAEKKCGEGCGCSKK